MILPNIPNPKTTKTDSREHRTTLVINLKKKIKLQSSRGLLAAKVAMQTL